MSPAQDRLDFNGNMGREVINTIQFTKLGRQESPSEIK